MATQDGKYGKPKEQNNFPDVWIALFNYCVNNNIHLLNLNPQAFNKQIYVMLFDKNNLKLLSTFFRRYSMGHDLINVDSNKKILIGFIPSTTKFFFNLWCCNFTMEYICKKFDDCGLAIQGNYNISPISATPNYYQGRNIKNGDAITFFPDKIARTSFLIFDNHNIIRIIDSSELSSYKPYGSNVQYVEGERIYKNGVPIIDPAKMDNLQMHDGSKIIIDHENQIITVGTSAYPSSSIGKTIFFDKCEYFINKSLMVICIDSSHNIIIIHHKDINKYNLILMLKIMNCSDAIIVADTPNINLIWKKHGKNVHNKTDFIGNPTELVSNIISFSV